MNKLPPSKPDLIHAYRRLLRASLHAVQFSKPARFVVVAQLREAFRDSSPDTLAARREQFNQDRIRRTVCFLNVAARETGLEHKIVKGLVHTAWSRRQSGSAYKSLLHVKAQKQAREEKGRQ